jgi:hypothetical protein
LPIHNTRFDFPNGCDDDDDGAGRERERMIDAKEVN